MGGNGDLLSSTLASLLHPDVAALLSDDLPPCTFERGDDLRVIERWNLRQTTTSSISVPFLMEKSPSIGSRYRSIASRMFFIASSRVSPSLMQPGSDGT